MLPRLSTKLNRGWPKHLSWNFLTSQRCSWCHIIGGVLSHKKHHVAYFSKKLSGAKLNYSIYNKEFHVIVQSLRHWQHYLLQQEFVIYLDYETLRYLNFQKKFNARYGRWVEFLQDHTYTLKHMSRVKNKVVDALSRRIVFLTKWALK